ncbi:BRO-N domain-containing protein [Rouxiella sp. Mn2063]|uniref:BRO-N domain-containing protein n=1 Tax=Rouxiella sp. Mn2063 TaxID=3395262 RepID=UPI003BEA4074
MNIVAKSDLNFQGKAIVPVAGLTGIWLTSSELADALQYKSAKSVTNLFNQNADEFTSGMTQVIESVTSGNYRKKVRVFSLRGAHLIAMFARTDVAKEFRRWVLDILDREVAQGNVHPAFNFESAAYNTQAINIHLSAIKEMWRGGLEDALKLMEYKHRGSISEHLSDMSFHIASLKIGISQHAKNGGIH